MKAKTSDWIRDRILDILRWVEVDIYGGIIALLGANLMTAKIIWGKEIISQTLSNLALLLTISGGVIIASRKTLKSISENVKSIATDSHYNEYFKACCKNKGYFAAVLFLLGILTSAVVVIFLLFSFYF